MIEYENKMKEIAKEDMRDGPIPGWDEVRHRFKLDQLSPHNKNCSTHITGLRDGLLKKAQEIKLSLKNLKG